ncbi:MAG: peptide transporter [Armatimonadetes bacterium]|nr:peptide transporter [Armatimonadota bacterium]
MKMREVEELAAYRTLIEEPTEYREGFSWRTLIGAVFVGFVMMPGSIYLGLVVGQSMGPAAEWTTIILFAEVARRSFQVLTRQEIYVLYYMAGGLASTVGGVLQLSGGVFAQLIWREFLRMSAPAGLGDQVPNWVAPPPESWAVRHRTFMHPDWYPAIGVVVATYVLSRVAWFTFGYILFRLTSDGEKLPFPLAPVTAQGATALAEASSKQESWRWRVFSIGSMLGIAFGLIYVAIPTLTSVLLLKPLQILPIPWIDFTQGTERFLPGAATGIGTNLASVIIGFVLPFWVVAGSFAAAMMTLIINPIAQVTGHMPTWRPGMEATRTVWAASIDIWLSFGIGTAVAVAVPGIIKMYRAWKEDRAKKGGRSSLLQFGEPPEGRGDFRIGIMLLLWMAATGGYVVLCRLLVPRFPLWWVIGYGFIWTPIQSYINARMVGLTGQFVGFPMIREATFILSGYKGVDIWFAPIPLANYGAQAQRFREIELTGTKFTGIVWTELVMFPVMLVCSLIFWGYIWRLKPIPSEAYPYAQKYWDFTALQQWLWFSATTEGGHRELFLRAIKPSLMVGGLAFGLGTYFILDALRLPVLLIYGFIRGLGMFPHFIVPQFAGALLSELYLKRRFGEQQWRRWTPVLYAGFACGMGLVGMLAIAFSLVSQSISQLPF